MWDFLLNIIAASSGVLLIAYVIHNIGSKKITEAQSLPWIVCGFLIIILGLAPGIINIISGLFGIWYPPTVIYVIGIAMLVFITLHHAISISKISNELNELAMVVSILRHENEEMKVLLKNMKGNQIETVTEDADFTYDANVTDLKKKTL